MFFLVGSFPTFLATAAVGFVFATLAKFWWGRRLLLSSPAFFSLGLFTRKGPSASELRNGSFTTTAVGYGLSQAVVARAVLSGPEPGYVSTPLLCLALAETLLDGLDGGPRLASQAGCCMPAALLGDGPSLDGFVDRLRLAGIHVSVN